MSCFFCKGEMKPDTTIHTVQLANCIVVIKNVPCLRCAQCGETVFSAETIEKIDAAYEKVKSGEIVPAANFNGVTPDTFEVAE